MLDQINSYLDDLEERNDALNGKLHELLESNRQARLDFRAQLTGSPTQDENHAVEQESSLPSEQNQHEENQWQDQINVKARTKTIKVDYSCSKFWFLLTNLEKIQSNLLLL